MPIGLLLVRRIREQRNPDEMKLAIVAYPTLDEVDRQWIESFRTKHDPQASRLGVHFTLVFPVDAVPGELEPDLELAARTIQPIAFELWSTHVVRDVVGSDALVFLVPSVGGPQIEALHDRLYAGVLRPHLRSEIPFVPHMTVGAASDLQLAERLAQELDVSSRGVRGMVAKMDLVDVGTHGVRSIKTYAFGTPQ